MTLSELLIALSVISIISTFNIVKVLTAQQTIMKKAVLKEIVSITAQVQQEGIVNGDLAPSTNQAYFTTRLGAIKLCDDSYARGCWTSGYNADDKDEPGAILPNDAQITGYNWGDDLGGGNFGNIITIDWNGAKPPNQLGDDVMRIAYCYTGDCSNAWGLYPAGLVAGRILPLSGSENLYYSLF